MHSIIFPLPGLHVLNFSDQTNKVVDELFDTFFNSNLEGIDANGNILALWKPKNHVKNEGFKI